MKSQAQLHAESKCATKEVITIFQNKEVNKGWQRNKSIQKYLQITKMKILPAMAIGVKRIHAKYFLDQMCSVLVIQHLRLKNVIFLFRRQIFVAIVLDNCLSVPNLFTHCQICHHVTFKLSTQTESKILHQLEILGSYFG